MAVQAWLTVITGTWVVYPWYREAVPTSARSTLLSSPDAERWPTFAMEWKEPIAVMSPILATVAAFLALRYGQKLARDSRLRRITMAGFILSRSRWRASPERSAP